MLKKCVQMYDISPKYVCGERGKWEECAIFVRINKTKEL